MLLVLSFRTPDVQSLVWMKCVESRSVLQAEAEVSTTTRGISSSSLACQVLLGLEAGEVCETLAHVEACATSSLDSQERLLVLNEHLARLQGPESAAVVLHDGRESLKAEAALDFATGTIRRCLGCQIAVLHGLCLSLSDRIENPVLQATSSCPGRRVQIPGVSGFASFGQ